MKNQSWQKLSPPPLTWKGRVWGEGDMPRGTVQSVKFHPVVEEGQLGQGGASSGPPGRSRPFSKLARAPDGCGGAGFESQFPFDWVSGSSAGLLLSWSVIHGLFLGLLYLCGFCWAAHNNVLINLHILPATPLFFLLRPEGVAGEWDCPAW